MLKEPQIWFVTQGATFSKDKGMKFLWAPEKGRDGKSRLYWENVLKVKRGDIIFNYSSGLKGISLATNDGYKAPNNDAQSPWGSEGYRVDIDLEIFNPPIKNEIFINNISSFNQYLNSVKNKPFNINGEINQGYLFEFTKEAGRFIRDLIHKKFANKSIDDFFDEVKLLPPSKKHMEEPNSSILTAIKTKPFIILAGLSGTGKSRLVRSLAYQFNNIELDNKNKINPPSNFQLIKVKPNWHDSSELIGYESRISGKDRLIVTDFVKFIVKAWHHHDTPFFLCLDEMNLAPVEQYFAEYLSVIETRRLNEGQIKTDPILSKSLIVKYAKKLDGVDSNFNLWRELEVTDDKIQNDIINDGLCLPQNLIVMGTVNMDETTHSFSRKVLDRAMTIEMNEIDLSNGLIDLNTDWDYKTKPLHKKLVISEKTLGAQVYSELNKKGGQVIEYLNLMNTKLEGTPFKIAYRVRDEFLLFAFNYSLLSGKDEKWLSIVLDEMTLMKILPRIEGDEDKTKLLDDLILLFQEKQLVKSLKKAQEMVQRRRLSHYTSFWP